MLFNKKIIILIGLMCMANGAACMSPGIDCKVAETIGDKTRLIGEFSSDELAFMRLLSLTEGIMAVAYPDQMQLHIRKLPDASSSPSSVAMGRSKDVSTGVKASVIALTQSVTACSSSSAKVMAAPSVQSMSRTSASTTTVQTQSSQATISASVKKAWEIEAAPQAPILRVPKVQQIADGNQVRRYPGELPSEEDEMSGHWCFGC
jgi:hypothetical protein